MADQAAIVRELYNRIGTLQPDKAAIVSELARRFGISAAPDAASSPNSPLYAPDAGAQMRSEALGTANRMMNGQPAVQTPEERRADQAIYATYGFHANPRLAEGTGNRGVREIAHGVEQMAEPGVREKAEGAAKVIEGAGTVGSGALPIALPMARWKLRAP